MRCNIRSFILSRIIAFKPFVINCLIIFTLLAPPLAYSDQSEKSLAYHQLITRVFPALDTAIFDALKPSGITATESGLKDVTAKAYREWHIKFLEIKNSPSPSNAKLLTQELLPDGFDLIMKIHRYEPPEQEGYSEVEFVIHYFLQIVGAVIKKNKSLEPLQEELIELFQCNNKDCEQLAGIAGMNDDPISLSDEIKLQLFVECTQKASDLSGDKKNDFCDAFLLQISF